MKKDEYFVPMGRIERFREWWANSLHTTRIAFVLAVLAVGTWLLWAGVAVAQEHRCTQVCVLGDAEPMDELERQTAEAEVVRLLGALEPGGYMTTFVLFRIEGMMGIRWVDDDIFEKYLTTDFGGDEHTEKLFMAYAMQARYDRMRVIGTMGPGEVYDVLRDADHQDPIGFLRELRDHHELARAVVRALDPLENQEAPETSFVFVGEGVVLMSKDAETDSTSSSGQ